VRFYRAGQIDKAIDCYRVALRYKPDYARAHDNLASALAVKGIETGDRELLIEARSHYEAAIRAWPEFELARENLRALAKYL
jgi:tetratricopeptide (TPR) repeat protein